MRISAFADVCLRVVMLLATMPTGSLLTSRAIAEGVDTPYNHVTKAVIRLRDLGLLEAVRGRSGGARISAEGRRATVGWLLRQLDTRADVAACETPDGPCPLAGGCGLRGALQHAKEAFYRELDGRVIASLAPRGATGPVAVAIGIRH